MSRHAYSDGTKEDLEYFNDRANKRREELSTKQLIKKLLDYLEQHIEMAEMEIKKHPKSEVHVMRRQWAENMIFYVNHNL